MTYAICAFNLCFLGFSVYLVYKIYKLVKFQDVAMLASIVCITLALVFFLAYNTLQLIRSYILSGENADQYFLGTNEAVVTMVSVDQVKVMLTFSAFVFDLYKWCVFIAATSQKVVIDETKSGDRVQGLMKWILWGVQSIVLTFFVVVWIGENSTLGSDSNPKWLKFSRYTTIGIFSAFLVVYLGVLVVLTKRLRLYFPKFYKQEKLNIVFATGAILVAIVSRVSTNIWYIYNSDEINDSYNKNTWLFPNYQLVNAFTASIFPLAATILSLLYALNQKKKQFNVDAKTFDPRVSNRKRTERESVRSLMEDGEDSLVMGLAPYGDSEIIKVAIGHTRDDIKLTPKQRKAQQSGFSSIF